MTAPGPTEEPLDPRALAEELDWLLAKMMTASPRQTEPTESEREVVVAIEMALAAFAELPESTRRLAHAAATVRARLGEGWRLNSYETVNRSPGNPRPCIDAWRFGTFLSFHRDVDAMWAWVISEERGEGRSETLDDAITAALTAIGEQG